MKNKFLILYKKNLNTYLIINSKNNKILWQVDLRKVTNINKNDKDIKISKNLDNYLNFLLNLSIFGLYPINNNFEFLKK